LETTSNTPFAVLKYAIVTWWDTAISLALYSIIWMFLCITVIFAAPATFVMYHLVAEILDDTMPEPRVLLRSLLTFFLTSWAWLLANVVVAGIIWINLSFYRSLETAWSDGLTWFVLAVSLVWIGIQFYAVPFYLLQEKKSLFLAWRNALFTALASPGFTLVLWIFIAILLVASIVLVIPVILGAPALIAMVGSVAVRERVKTYKAVMKAKEPESDTQQNDKQDAG
jgi:hypothetical protein